MDEMFDIEDTFYLPRATLKAHSTLMTGEL